MLKRITKFLSRFILALTFLCIIGLSAPKFVMWIFAQSRIYSTNDVPQTRVAIVFGAGLLLDGSAGPVLSDRVQTAVILYQEGVVDKLLMSGDNSTLAHNEPGAMYQYALERGVPDEDIILDYAGRRTYDTCYRAKHIFQVDEAILITQDFHMARALFLCNWFGVDSVGVEANNRDFSERARRYWDFRELFATFQAMWDVLVTKPLPVLGEVEPIE